MDNRQMLIQLKGVFDLCDTTGDGFINVDSFLSLGHQYLAPHTEDVERLLYLLDPSGKGYITFEDFSNGVLIAMQGGNLNQLESLNHSTNLFVMGEGDMNEYGILGDIDDDLTRSSCHRRSLESFGDTDSAIVVVPTNSESGSGSPDFGRKLISVSDGEEKFECYGEDRNCGDYEENPAMSTAMSIPVPSSKHRHGKSGQPFQKRSSWLRTSLRRSPSERRRVSSNALASSLYRSSSFNSSSHHSSSGESDDMHADLSLEEDVLDLNARVHILQKQMTALANTHNTNDDKYSRAKQENAALTAKVHMLEEQIRELEIRSEDRLREEQQRYKDLMGRHERERSLDLETYTLKLQTVEKENVETREEVFRLRSQVDRLKQNKELLQEQLSENEYSMTTLREELRKIQETSKRERDAVIQERTANARVVEGLMKEMHDLKRYKAEYEQNYTKINGHVSLEPPSRLRDLEEQIRLLKEENRGLHEANEELQAQLLNTSIAEGRNLLHSGEGISLAAEFEAMSKDEVMETLREQREVNTKLKTYIDGILLNIIDSYPSLLEVKSGEARLCHTK